MTAVVHAEIESAILPAAIVRSQVTVPLRFPDGFTATAEVMTFHGLADNKEHLLLRSASGSSPFCVACQRARQWLAAPRWRGSTVSA